MTSRIRRQLVRVARLEAARRDKDAARIANDLRKKFAIHGKAPEDPDVQRELRDEIDRSPLAAEVRDKLFPPLEFNLTPNQLSALADFSRDKDGNILSLEEMNVRARERMGS